MSGGGGRGRTLTRRDLADRLRGEFGTSTLARELVNTFFDEVERALVEEGRVKLHNFGTFETIDKRERIGRNPHSGEPMKISARRVVRFKPSGKLCDEVRLAGRLEG